MGATSKSSAHEVPGWRVQRLVGKMKSFTECHSFAKHVASSSANIERQGSQSGRGVTSYSKAIEVDEESSSHCKDKTHGLQSWRESLKNCSKVMGEEANQNIKFEKLDRSSVPGIGSSGRDIPMDTVVIIDDEDNDTGANTCDVSSDSEQNHSDSIEINSSNVISDTELDGDDGSIESDSSSNDSASSLSKQTVEQTPNAWPPGSLCADLSDDDDDCQVVYECCSQPQLLK